MSEETTPQAVDAAPAPTPPAAPTTAPTPPSPPPASSGTIQLTAEEYRALIGAQHAVRLQQQAEAEKARKAESDKLRALADKEGIEVALRKMQADREESERKYQDDLKSYQSRLLDYQKSTQLTQHLAGANWVSPAAARDAMAKIAAQFETVEVGGQAVTRQVGTGKLPAEAIPELLKTEEYAHYLKALATGGAGAAGAHKPGESPKPDPARRMEEQIRNQIGQASAGAIGLRAQYLNSNSN